MIIIEEDEDRKIGIIKEKKRGKWNGRSDCRDKRDKEKRYVGEK